MYKVACGKLEKMYKVACGELEKMYKDTVRNAKILSSGTFLKCRRSGDQIAIDEVYNVF